MNNSERVNSHERIKSPKRVKRSILLFVFSALLVGLTLGIVSTGLAFKWVAESNSVKNGAWFHNPYVGSDEASGYTRALVSLVGFLGMTRQETVYFVARSDDEKNALSGSCTYSVKGFFTSDQARWWSITAYNAMTTKLLPNAQRRYSFNGDNVTLNDDGSFTLLLSSQAQLHPNWIPLEAGTAFDLTLRMYNPSQTVREGPHEIALPQIRKEACL